MQGDPKNLDPKCVRMNVNNFHLRTRNRQNAMISDWKLSAKLAIPICNAQYRDSSLEQKSGF